MRIVTLILLPWIIYGILSYLGWWGTAVNIGIAFVLEAIYFTILYVIDGLLDYNDKEPETALERARRVVG